jgi:hypothetical protein
MKYTIQEILPGQIRVEYENNSWAIVPIPANSTMEEIDHAVSQYDPDFLPSVASSINPNIAVGLSRTSTQKEEKPQVEPTPPIPQYEVDFNNIIFKHILIADYFSNVGDNRLKEAINQKVKRYADETEINIDSMLLQFISDDDIMKQAEEELNNGK